MWIHGDTWGYMWIHGDTCGYMWIYGNTCGYMGIYVLYVDTCGYMQWRREGGHGGGAIAPGPGPVVGARAKLDFVFVLIGSQWGIQGGGSRDDHPPPRQCPRGGGCLWMSKRGGPFFNFPEGGWRHADNVQGGVLVNVFTPPPLQEILYPRLTSIRSTSRWAIAADTFQAPSWDRWKC